ncbi:MAG TPA: Gfo/Idh/MocA family oxidoreductase [Parvibaculum sp.]|jgi:predicted dehydrogenase
MPEHKIRLGMVGGGNGSMMGDMHRLASARNGHFHFVAGALSSTKERADESAKRAGLAPERSYASFEEMAAAEAARPDGVEAVAILTPNHLHAPVARAFMANGVHIICEKPMTATRAEAEDLAALAAARDIVFLVTHSYTAFPMVRRAREIARSGALGQIRSLRSSYLQGWMADLEQGGATPQSNWHFDPARSGIAGTLADVGSHAFHIAAYVTGLELEAVAADLTTFGSFSALDNDGSALLRFKGGARGSLACSQLAAGNANAFGFAVYGSTGALRWSVETPNELHLSAIGKPDLILTPSDDETGELAWWGEKGFKGFEAYFAAFARLYADAAELIAARKARRAPDAYAALAPTIADGLAVMRFIDAAVRSSKANAAWVSPE